MKCTTVAAATLLSLLAACGGSNSQTTDEESPTAAPSTSATSAPTTAPAESPTDDVATAVRAYSKAYLTGDGATAYDLLSKRCRAKMPLSDFAALTEQAKQLYGNVAIKSLDVAVDGRKATATYTYPVAAINQRVDEGGWKNDDC